MLRPLMETLPGIYPSPLSSPAPPSRAEKVLRDLQNGRSVGAISGRKESIRFPKTRAGEDVSGWTDPEGGTGPRSRAGSVQSWWLL